LQCAGKMTGFSRPDLTSESAARLGPDSAGFDPDAALRPGCDPQIATGRMVAEILMRAVKGELEKSRIEGIA
jgi:hypothetical protein